MAAQNMPSGIFGAGYGGGFNQDYNSVIDEMYEQGLIEDKDFSIALGSIGADDGMSLLIHAHSRGTNTKILQRRDYLWRC